MDSQIPRLLFYSAFLAVAVLLAWLGYYLATPKPADYWGLDSSLSPADLAKRAYAANDFRFLTIRSDLKHGPSESHITGILGCTNHPAGPKIPVRPNTQIDIEDRATAEWLFDYVWAYNARLAQLLNDEKDAGCRVFRTM